MPSIELDDRMLAALIKRLNQSGALMEAEAMQAMREAEKYVRGQVRLNMLWRRYSEAALRQADHPYARRHGTIQATGTRPYAIHRRTGAALQALKGAALKIEGEPGFDLRLDESKAPHLKYLIHGTKYMLPRDVLMGTMQQANVRKWIGVILKRNLKKALEKTGTGKATR